MALGPPAVRLAICCEDQPKRLQRNSALEWPAMRLAHVPGAQGDNNLLGQRGVEALPPESAPGLLISYVYLAPFLKLQSRYVYRDWVLDSGAFSAHRSGVEIKLDEYIAKARELLASDPRLTEVYALDVIGDWRASLKNTEAMWAGGVEAIPCYYAGEPWDVLVGMARDYPKVALGGMAMQKVGAKQRWAEQCFSRIWPKKIHGFGYGAERYIKALPFHSTDATSWETGPCQFGTWHGYRGAQIRGIRGSNQNLRVEVEHYLRTEREARSRWAKEMTLLETS